MRKPSDEATGSKSGGYEFGAFRLDLGQRALLRGHAQLPLTAKAYDTLLVLIEHAGLAVDKDTLLTRVWADVAVEENSIAKAISDLRRALGDDARSPRFVATLSGHGYRFIAPVTRRAAATDSEGHRFYLKGRFHLAKRTVADCRHAIAAFERAIAAGSDVAEAYGGIADAHVFLGVQAIVMGGDAPSETFPRAKAAIARALALDDRVAEAYTAHGQVSLLYDWDPEAAARAHTTSLSLDPQNAAARHAYSLMLSFLGKHDVAAAEMEHALRLDPLSPIVNTNLGRLFFHARRYDDAVAQFHRTLELHPYFPLAHYRLALAHESAGRCDAAMEEFRAAEELSQGAPLPVAGRACVLARAGRREEASALLASLERLAKQTYVAAPGLAEICLALDDHDRGFEWLDRAIDERSGMLVALQVNPRYDVVRRDGRFDRLLEKVGLWAGRQK